MCTVFHVTLPPLQPTNDKSAISARYPHGLNDGIYCWLNIVVAREYLNQQDNSDGLRIYQLRLSERPDESQNSDPAGRGWESASNAAVVNSLECTGLKNEPCYIIKDVDIIIELELLNNEN